MTPTDLRADETAMTVLTDLLAPAANGRAGAASATEGYAVLPSAAHPRYLVPLRSARAAAGIRFRPSSGRADTLARLVLRPALRTGVARLLPNRLVVETGDPSHPSLLGWIGAQLGRDDLSMAVAIGNPRPNRKPVLQVIDPVGGTVCFGKVGLTEHTCRLIRNETAFLARQGSTARVVVADLLASGDWKGREIALLSDLAPRIGTRLALTPEVVLEIARMQPTERHPVADSPWWAGVRRQVETSGDDDLARCLDAVEPRLADRAWTFGAWHGDMAPWNAAWDGDRLVTWDWERTSGPVPVGFDAVHAAFQVAHLDDGQPVPAAAAGVVGSEAALLEAVGIAAADHRALVGAYLLELRLRLADDARFGPLGRQQRLADALSGAIVEGRWA